MKLGGPGKCEHCGNYVDNVSFHRILCEERNKGLTTNNEPNTHMKRVMIETPLMARGERTVEMNLEYARKCMKDSLSKSEAPFAMHLLYTQVLNDLKPEDRMLGLDCGHVWAEKADLIAFYLDYGFSSGMHRAHTQAQKLGIKVEYRLLKPTEASATSLV